MNLALRLGPHGIRRGVVVALLALGPAVWLALPTLAAGSPRSQDLVVLLSAHTARRAPDQRAQVIETVAARRPLTRVRTVLPVLGDAGREDTWLRVELPGRPNGHTGWIAANRTRVASTPWRIRVALVPRRVIVFRAGRIVRRFAAIVGKPSTPTPRGRFFVEEALRLRKHSSGAPFALATSARSDAFQEFDGGPGQVALHGTGSLSGRLGTALSHGCVRVGRAAITWLARRIGAGVPVTIGRRA